MQLVRLIRIQRIQIPVVSALLARAFWNDPLMEYAFPDPALRQRRLSWLIGLNVRYGYLYGEVCADDALRGAAIWLPPKSVSMTLGRMFRAGMFAAPFRLGWSALRRLAITGDYSAALHQRSVSGEHWYLSQIGVEPNRQGQGIGRGLLSPMFTRLDENRLPCYLDTANETTIPMYQKYGFRVVHETRLPDHGPRIWAMLRQPG
ncbi:MAG: GNAT family N-acetyltransferase [Anaerolineae bacterium]|nr:GNAT family N-acetyltransferase [Anaerolineae bacterium]